MARSQRFGQLLKAGISSIAHCEDKTAPVIEDDLGNAIGVASHTIQRYKAGHVPPEPRSVEILAHACVKRGHLNREWLRSFLFSARYLSPDPLIEQLCPSSAPRERPQRLYTNLPAPTYSQFVMRQQAYEQVIEGLDQRAPVVLFASLGGMGKTSLAREVTALCLAGGDKLPSFDAAVWVSDKGRPGTTNLSVVLDEIARTLDFPGLTQFAFEEKRYEVEQLLRRQKVLLVIDNFETITDAALLEWLLRLPEPSKAIVTTREFRREFRSCWPIDLSGMTEDEAHELIGERLRVLKIERLVADPAQLTPLIRATGGNPKAIEMALGLIKHRSLQQVLDDLLSSRGELFEDLFTRAWALLDEPARAVLLALPLFIRSASTAALRATADVQPLVFERAVEQLTDLSLVDLQRASLSSEARYGLHPLVRAFAAGKLADRAGIEQAIRERWVGWYRELAGQMGFCWDNLSRLERLDDEHENLFAVLNWTFQRQRYADTLVLIEGVRYYYNVRGLWDDRLSINLMRATAARRLGDRANEALGLAHHAEILSKQGNVEEAGGYLGRLAELAQTPDLPGDVLFEIAHARGLYARACGDLAAAEQIWRDLLALSSRLGGQKYVVNRRWLATCLYQQGRLDEAQQLFRASLEDAMRIGDLRSVSGNVLKLARLDMDQGHIAEAEEMLAEYRPIAERLQDRRRLGEWHRLAARLRRLRGDGAGARAELEAACNLFERMGMRRDLSEARAELEQLGPA